MSTAQQAADEIIASPEFTSNPAGAVQSLVARAMTEHHKLHRDNARLLTHMALILVDAAASPHVVRGESLDSLAEVYGEP